jgi:hypothetical protein
VKRFIVTTSIYPPSEATLKYAAMEDWSMILVGDLKTPHQAYFDLSYDYKDFQYLHPEFQETHYKELSDAIGWNKVMRRNIGFIEAYRQGAEIVASIDDDNIPYSFWGDQVWVGKVMKVDNCWNESGVFDPMQRTNHPELWHRGFPLDLIQESKTIIKGPQADFKILFQADLWNGDPDVDAVCRKMYRPKDLTLNLRYNRPFTSQNYMPFNSQNTFIAREALPYYMVLPHVGRMDDIWGGYIAQYLLNTRPVFMPATVYQERNEQSLKQNFQDEVIGYLHTLDFIRDIENYQNYLPEQTLRAFELYRKAYE